MARSPSQLPTKTARPITVLKLLPLSLLILFGFGRVDLSALLGASIPPLDGLGETALILMYAYVGFEGTVVTAGEGRSPRRDIPRALIHTIVLIGIFYFLVQAISMATLPGLAESATKVVVFHADQVAERDRLERVLRHCLDALNLDAKIEISRGCAVLYEVILGDWRTWRPTTPIRFPEKVGAHIERLKKIMYYSAM